jgi:hypothetical protein
LNKKLTTHKQRLKSGAKKKLTWAPGTPENVERAKDDLNYDIDFDEDDFDEIFLINDDQIDKFILVASMGQALGSLSKYDDSLGIINREGFNDKIIDYIHKLFEWNVLIKILNIKKAIKEEQIALSALNNVKEDSEYDFDNDDDDDDNDDNINPTDGDNNENEIPFPTANTSISRMKRKTPSAMQHEKPILFEQYIGHYLICLSNLAMDSYHNKQVVVQLNIFEFLISFWTQLQYMVLYHTENELLIKGGSFGSAHTSVSFNFTSTFNSKNKANFSNPVLNVLSNLLIRLESNEMKEEYTHITNPDEMVRLIQYRIEIVKKLVGSLPMLLIKNLRLATIECMAKVFLDNFNLKKKYIYQSDFDLTSVAEFTLQDNQILADLDWFKVISVFVKIMVSCLDRTINSDIDLQLEVLRFLRFISQDDSKMQTKLVNIVNVSNSNLINNFRFLLRKR